MEYKLDRKIRLIREMQGISNPFDPSRWSRDEIEFRMRKREKTLEKSKKEGAF